MAAKKQDKPKQVDDTIVVESESVSEATEQVKAVAYEAKDKEWRISNGMQEK